MVYISSIVAGGGEGLSAKKSLCMGNSITMTIQTSNVWIKMLSIVDLVGEMTSANPEE